MSERGKASGERPTAADGVSPFAVSQAGGASVVVKTEIVSAADAELPLPLPLVPVSEFFAKPHTVLWLMLAVLGMVYSSGVFSPEPRFTFSGFPGREWLLSTVGLASPPVDAEANNARRGVFAAAGVFMLYSVLQGPDSLFVRPSKAFWRLVHGFAVLYVMLLTYLLFQSPAGARAFMRHLSPSLGVEPPERSYAADCALSSPVGRANLAATAADEFVLAHSLGWWGIALAVRDARLLAVSSVGFELMERTFRHWLPNFNECWWDSWILDVALCNAAGIAAGLATVAYFGSRPYDWGGTKSPGRHPGSPAAGAPGPWRRLLGAAVRPLTPVTLELYRWRTLDGPGRFLQASLVVVFIQAVILNSFFLKSSLWIPPRNPLNAARLLLWQLLSLPAANEYYLYLESRAAHRGGRLGAFAWLALAGIAVEWLVVAKVGRGMFVAPWPREVLAAWAAGGIAAAGGLSAWALLARAKRREAKAKAA